MLNFFKRWLEHRYLPVLLTLGAILVTWPALRTGLFMDDLMQRAVELKPEQLPAHLRNTGIPTNSGSLRTVLRHLFPGVGTTPQSVRQARQYGLLPWWAPEDMKLGLWRPVTAFTHWLDYRLFPDTPLLMHAENIACFAAIVFLVALIYRKLMPAGWVAGGAALLYLLDFNSYFPVMFVANRGFLLSLLFGLLCLHAHHHWRTAKSTSGGVLSALFLALSLFANEGGASTLAFILAYALVLEPGPFRKRALTLLPSILVLVLWRAIYTFSGAGLAGIGIYLDPGNEPLAFARVVMPRALVLLGGQVSSVPPDVLLAVNSSLRPEITAFFCAIPVAALMVFLPWMRRDKTAAFWLAVMLLAVIPAATVMPMSKNLGFVAVGAYGLIARFVAGLVAHPGPLPKRLPYRILAWMTGILLILVHVPGAIAGRVVIVTATTRFASGMSRLADVGTWPNIENENVIVVNPPSALALTSAPFYRAYHRQPLPRTLRALVPGCTGLKIQRTADNALVIESEGPNLFSCDDVGPVSSLYAANAGDRFLLGGSQCKRGDRYDLSGLTVEVLESDASGLPSRVAFRFNTSLDSPDFRWLWFNVQAALAARQPYQHFKIPAIGQTVTIPGLRPGMPADQRIRRQ